MAVDGMKPEEFKQEVYAVARDIFVRAVADEKDISSTSIGRLRSILDMALDAGYVWALKMEEAGSWTMVVSEGEEEVAGAK